ncbi:hypothetical protein [Microbacterium sp. UFMG61]|jgi:hypothetical protein|uniref:hypothetical protein n=1 Tax=Microbacterium sp. UFMG61 TaxID=2745935 RepID=UPI0018902D85|nr:hypothetical protein [Microbacterium sp. UFMG61]
MGAADSHFIKHYEIRLPYARSDALAAAFPELDAVQIDRNTTLLSGPIRDQAELHGLLMRIAGMGLEITEVRQKP